MREHIENEVKSLYDHQTNEQTNNFIEVPDGDYIVEIMEMEVGMTKTGKNALKVKFRITSGEHIGKLIYMTTVLTSSFTISKASLFLKSLGTDTKVTVSQVEQFGTIAKTILNKIKGMCEYDLKYWTNNRGYKEYDIVGIYDLI